MEKLMWAGFWIEIIMLITIFILIFLQQQVPDLVANIFTGGMLICIISSFFARRKVYE
jgi:hypothetical protein